jgi:hypothetical protein
MRKFLPIFFLVACLSIAFGCARRPILEVQDRPFGINATKEDVIKAITRAGLSRGWQIIQINDDLLEGQLIQRQHTIMVSIPVTETSYSILYKDSENMKGDPESGTIHKRYNTWVRNLEKAISLEIARIGPRQPKSSGK